ncbi:MAG: serine/threonine-protein kinase [Myxococcota bacterium]
MGDQRLSFTFDTCLGKGGFGEVYLATLTRPGGLEKRVAVKVLKEDLRHADAAVQRLRDEGRMLAILDHPCILRVLEMTLIRGRVALVTEYIDGIDLARCCRPNRLLPKSVVVGALGEVASALNCAWTTPSPETGKPLKLIHRDVKPENIRIGRHGEVKLLDFGIARTTEMFRHAKTAQGDLPFTPGYAAPEAFTKGFQGSASDIYALGVSMFRLLTGERLYEDMELSDQVTICCLPERYAPFLRQRLSLVDTPEARAAAEGATEGLVGLLRDMLAYEPSHRPSASEVEHRCAALVDALPGPNHVRWARAQEFPEPTGLPEGTLTGQTIEEDVLEPQQPQTKRGVQLMPRTGDASRGLLDAAENGIRTPEPRGPRPQPKQEYQPSAVADLTPPMVDIPAPPPPPPPSSLQALATPQRPQAPPPPVPTGLQSVRPHTAPFERPKRGEPVPADTFDIADDLDASVEGVPTSPGADAAPPPVPPSLSLSGSTVPAVLPGSASPTLTPAAHAAPSTMGDLDAAPSMGKAPSTMGDLEGSMAPANELGRSADGADAGRPEAYNTKATLDAWMHEADLAEARISLEETVERPPPVAVTDGPVKSLKPVETRPRPPDAKRATPATSARIERPGPAQPPASGGSTALRFLGLALALGVLVGGGVVMIAGIAALLFFWTL